jgi:hypothetical protein
MIIDVLKTAAENLPSTPNGKFRAGEQSWQNLVHDEEPESTGVYLDKPLTWEIDPVYLNEIHRPRLFFWVKSDLEWTEEQHQVALATARQMVREFIVALTTGGGVEYVNSINALEVYNVHDFNADGIILTLKTKPLLTAPIC